MDLQTLVALGIVATAGGYLAWRYIRAWMGKATGGCHSGCGGCIHNTACPSKNMPQQPRKVVFNPREQR